ETRTQQSHSNGPIAKLTILQSFIDYNHLYSPLRRSLARRLYRFRAHFFVNERLLFIKTLPHLIFVGDYRHGKRPFQMQVRIVVQETAFGSWRIKLAHLVAGVRVVTQNLITV